MKKIYDTVIADTSKGKRVWIQGIAQFGWTGGTQYSVQYTDNLIVYKRTTEGKTRKVTASKGGVIDTVGKKVTQWAQDSTSVRVAIDQDSIIILRN